MRRLPLTLAMIAATFPAIALDAIAQDPLKTLPNNYKLILDNPDLSVIRVHYGPHEKLPVHDHSNYPTLYVYLNSSGEVRLTHDETPPFVMLRPPTKLGSFRIAPARPERHSIENLSELPSDFLRVEFKKMPLETLSKPVRGAVPDPLKPGVTEEFQSPQLTIDRIVCNPGPACTDPASPLTLVIALSALETSSGKQMQKGDIDWQQNTTQIAITATGNSPAHILAIQLHPAK